MLAVAGLESQFVATSLVLKQAYPARDDWRLLFAGAGVACDGS